MPGVSIFLYQSLLEGYGTELDTFSLKNWTLIQDTGIQWREDDNPHILCPAELTPVAFYESNYICCAESFLYLHGVDPNIPSLSLPAPAQKLWNNEGSICFYLFFPSMPPISLPMVMLQYDPIQIITTYQTPNMLYNFVVGNNSVYIASIVFNQQVWNSICFTFQASSTFLSYGVSESFTRFSFSYGPYNYVSLAPTANKIQFLPNNSSFPLFFKNLLILSKAITPSEHFFYFWGNM